MPAFAGIPRVHPTEDSHCVIHAAVQQQVHGRLRHVHENDGDDQRRQGTDDEKESPRMEDNSEDGVGEFERDDGQSQKRDRDVSDHPKCGDDTESPAPVLGRLELAYVRPNQRDAAPHPVEIICNIFFKGLEI